MVVVGGRGGGTGLVDVEDGVLPNAPSFKELLLLIRLLLRLLGPTTCICGLTGGI